MSFQDPIQTRAFVHTGILGLDEILGGQLGSGGQVEGRLQGERILLVGPPGSGKTLLALSLVYKALKRPESDNEHGLFLTTEHSSEYLIDSAAGLFTDLESLLNPPNPRLVLEDFPPFQAPFGNTPPLQDQAIIDNILRTLRELTHEALPSPRHVVLDGLTAMQAVLSTSAEARRLTNLIINYLSSPKGTFDLIVVTAEVFPALTTRSYVERTGNPFDDYLFDTVIYLDVIETPADRRLRTIEVSKSRERHARTGRHTFSIVSQKGLPNLIRSKAARDEISKHDAPVFIFPREPRGERPVSKEESPIIPTSEYLRTGVKGLDALLDCDHHRGLLKRSTTVLIGGPGTAGSLLGLRYLAQGLKEDSDRPILLVSFGRDREDFTILANNFTWLRSVLEQSDDKFHFLYYRPVNLDQNRLMFEIRHEVETYSIDRVLIDSLSSLPLVDINEAYSSDFLVTLVGLLKELRCTSMLTYASERPPEQFTAPVRFIPSLADNIFILRNKNVSKNEIKKTLFILKARGTNAMSDDVEFIIEDELILQPLQG